MDAYRLIRILPDGTEMQITPSLDPDSLIAAGIKLSEEYPDFDLFVISSRGEIQWQRKSTPMQGSAPHIND